MFPSAQHFEDKVANGDDISPNRHFNAIHSNKSTSWGIYQTKGIVGSPHMNNSKKHLKYSEPTQKYDINTCHAYKNIL